jgi:hypothetical protein
MKKIISGALFGAALMIAGVLSFTSTEEAEAFSPCPTGYSSVVKSWFGPSNNTYFTLCGCQVARGYEAGGSCGGLDEIM